MLSLQTTPQKTKMKSVHCNLLNSHFYTSHVITPVQLLIPLLLLLSVAAEAERPWNASSLSTSSDGDAQEGSSNVSPPMAIVVIVLVLGFFITGCFSIYIQQCTDRPSSADPAVVDSGMNNISKVIQGLEQSVIDTFPVIKYSVVEKLKVGKGAVECAVCLSEFQEEETLRLLPTCDHVFHSECIDAWVVGQATCPVCRANLVVLPNSEEILSDSPEPPETPTTESDSNGEVQITISTLEHDETMREKYFRSHSTGHSLILADGENWERYTLKLSGEVRRKLLAQTKLKRATSLVVLPRRSSSGIGF